jgi:hypothetical protein
VKEETRNVGIAGIELIPAFARNGNKGRAKLNAQAALLINLLKR